MSMTNKKIESLCIDVYKAKTAEDFLRYLRPESGNWDLEPRQKWIFRGQLDASKHPKPSAWRKEGIQKLKPIINTIIALDKEKYAFKWNHVIDAIDLEGKGDKHYHAWGVHYAAIHEAIRQFAESANALGVYIPDYLEWVYPALNILDELDSRDEYLPDDFDAFAQHHGIPTPLLDFSGKAAVAAWFATDGDKKKVNPKELCVWAVNTEVLIDHFNFSIYKCRHWQHSFLHAQDGLFLLYRKSHDWWNKKRYWPTFTECVANEIEQHNCNKPFRKITLPHTEIDTLRKLLYFEGISGAHLKPNYDNVVKSLIDSWARNKKVKLIRKDDH